MDILKEYEEVFNVAEYTAKKYFSYYKHIFIDNNIDAEDLIQETKMVIFELIKKYSSNPYVIMPKEVLQKPSNNGHIYLLYEDIFKLSNQAVGWKLREILRDSKNNYQNKNVFLEDNVLENLLTKNELRENKSNLNFEELSAILDQQEYYIIYSIFVEGKTNELIAREFKCSKQYINFLYFKILKKVKSYIKFKDRFLNEFKSN